MKEWPLKTTSKKYLSTKGRLLMVGVLILLVSISYVTAASFEKKVKDNIHKNFLVESRGVVDSVQDRVGIYVSALEGGRGLFTASETVNRQEWNSYVESLRIQDNYPGIQGIGYSIFVSPEEKESHIEEIRAEGFPDYTIRPEGDRDIYTSIIYLEPFDERNRQAFGFDMYSNEVRRAAMDSAAEENRAVASGVITLVQEIDEDVQPGFLIYVPFYDGAAIDTLEQRQSNITSYIYSPFRARNFIDGAIKNNSIRGIEFRIIDTTDIRAPGELYNTIGDAFEDNFSEAVFSEKMDIDIAGRTWTFAFYASDNFEGVNDSENNFMIIFITGIVLSLLIVFLMYIFYTRRTEAVSIAESMTSDLQAARKKAEEALAIEIASKKRVEKSLKETKLAKTKVEEKMEEIERLNKVMVGREMKMIDLKKEIAELKKKKKK